MAYKIIRPRHGIKSLWDRYKSRIYKLGEMLVESPESGVGSGPVNIKFGDGVSDYESLPYAVLAPVNEVSEGVDNPPTSDAVKKALGNVNVEVVDNLESESTKLALSANQGRLLNERVNDLLSRLGEEVTSQSGSVTKTGVPVKGSADVLVTFPKSFSAIPTVSIEIVSATDPYENNAYTYTSYSIKSVSKGNFTVTLKTTYPHHPTTVVFKWSAVAPLLSE